MKPRLRVLHRVLHVYSALERMEAAELQRLQSGVHETERAIRVEKSKMITIRQQGQGALTVCDGIAWRGSEAEQSGAEWNGRRLLEKRAKQVELAEAALERYISSRLRTEQISETVRGLTEEALLEKKRRDQGVDDDRFLSKKNRVKSRGSAEEMDK